MDAGSNLMPIFLGLIVVVVAVVVTVITRAVMRRNRGSDSHGN